MDTSVSPQKIDELVQRLGSTREEQYQYRRYEALDHGLKDSDGKSLRKEGYPRYKYMVKGRSW